MKAQVASLYQAVDIAQEIPPLLIGERANAHGSKKFRELLLAEDFEACLKVALDQEQRGAQVIDLCVAYAGRDETADMCRLVKLCARSLKAPLMLDSTTPSCIEAALALYPGRCIVNSVNLEDGGVNLRRVCRAAKKYGAAVVALTIDKKGMAMRADDKLAVAKEILRIAVEECGLRPRDILFDCLTFTVASGDETLENAAMETLEAIRRVKAELPGCHTVLGLSNISFGLTPPARRALNSVFLHEAVEAGLDAAIVDAAKIVPLASIPEEDREVCLDLLYNRRRAGEEKSPLLRLIDHFAGKADQPESAEQELTGTAEEALFQKVRTGDKEGLEDILAMLRGRMKPTDIINQVLVPAMRRVGELFGKGEILLPFVLQSAEVMKAAVSLLEPFMDKSEAAGGPSILLATVQGDVHDIGKNLVDIILSNNGYTVHNIGIKVPAGTIIEKAKELKPDLIGLSGLLVKSALIMQESLPLYREAGLTMPVLLGGAALTRKFVAENCAPVYPGPVVYCSDAFAGLKAVQAFERGALESSTYDEKTEAARLPGAGAEIAHDNPVPTPPFFGRRHTEDIDPAELPPLVNKAALFRGRWGYRRGKMNEAEYEKLLRETVAPLFARLCDQALREGWIAPKAAWGYFPCFREGDRLVVRDGEREFRFNLPRQQGAPGLCIADYFKDEASGGDVAAFFAVTIGPRFSEETARLYQANAYHDYLMLHGLGVELTDALAEWQHRRIREELGVGTRPEPGCRYAFGYPSCPDLELQRPLFALLEPEAIGITLSETLQMSPEQSTTAIVVHHPAAKYFAI